MASSGIVKDLVASLPKGRREDFMEEPISYRYRGMRVSFGDSLAALVEAPGTKIYFVLIDSVPKASSIVC